MENFKLTQIKKNKKKIKFILQDCEKYILSMQINKIIKHKKK